MDEASAARPSASPRKPPSARAVTAMPATTLRKRNKWDEGKSRLQPEAQVIGGGAQVGATIVKSTRKKEETRDVASTQPVEDDAQDCASGCSTL